MIQTLIPAYRPPVNSQPLSSASIASRESNPIVVETSSTKPFFEQSGSTPARAAQADSPVYDDPRKQAATKHQNTEDRNRELAQQLDIQQLSARDREVRAHERAHAAVGGQFASAPTYQYERGPDGVNYAVAGEVSISTSPVAGDPQATIEKAQIIKRAALAPAEPSPQDRQVASEAAKMEIDARAQLTLLQQQSRLEPAENSATKPENDKAAVDLEPTHTLDSTSSNNDDDSVQNLSQVSSTADRLSESLGQKIMFSSILQDPPAGYLINEIA